MLSLMRRWQLECPDFFTSGNTETWELTNIDMHLTDAQFVNSQPLLICKEHYYFGYC